MKFKFSAKPFAQALLAPVLVASIGAVLALTSMSSADPVLAAKDKLYSEVAFTKWVTIAPGYPIMAGYAEPGSSFSGEILARDATLGNGRLAQIDAIYQFDRGERSFTAQVRVIQDNQKGTAVITGVVTAGWLQGSFVYGRYAIVDCASQANALNGRCFRGSLRISAAD